MNNSTDRRLFWACFIMLITTAFGFVVRTQIMDDLAKDFNFSPTQSGELIGAWFWPFGVSIILFSLVIDKIGYGNAVVFALICQVTSSVLAIYSKNYGAFYAANVIGALGNGTVEAVINPVVATMFSRDKTKWLNILHAGWPGGLVIGGILAIMLPKMIGAQVPAWGVQMGLHSLWQFKLALVFIPILLYALLIIGCKFPVNERVAAGVSYRSMLKEAGLLSWLVATTLIVLEVTRVFEEMGYILNGPMWNDVLKQFDIPNWGVVDITNKMAVKIALIAVPSILFFAYVLSLGRMFFFFLVIIMIPLATTELGTDSWITPLMTGEMANVSKLVGMEIEAGWVLVYTSFIMMVLRFFAGPIAHKFSPLGLLAISAAIAACGLFALSKSTGLGILAAATLYAFGKTFFWPTMLGVESEQCPKGGALTLNMLAGIGMIGVGIIGSPLLGNIQDKFKDKTLLESNPALHAKIAGAEKTSVFGTYSPLDADKIKELSKEDKQIVEETEVASKKNALATVAILPCFMLVCYLILILYFKARGGYHAQVLATPNEVFQPEGRML
ncbi:MAG TPA: MFS transporter [Gemmataceae bacterium]|jgi:MFS family permease|nr:MFS transporter [Gemmataceae bacterium]